MRGTENKMMKINVVGSILDEVPYKAYGLALHYLQCSVCESRIRNTINETLFRVSPANGKTTHLDSRSSFYVMRAQPYREMENYIHCRTYASGLPRIIVLRTF